MQRSNRNRSFRSLVSAATLVSAMILALPARAEGWLIDGVLAGASGSEGADPGTGNFVWQRARARVVAGADWRNDEVPDSAVGFRLFAELERRGSIGGELRYTHWLSESIGVHGSLLGTAMPETLFGAGIGGSYVLKLGDKLGVFLEPSFNALPLGSDLPGETVLVWVLFSGGLRVSL